MRCHVSNLNCQCQLVVVLVNIFCQLVFVGCQLTFSLLSVGELSYNVPKHNFLNQNICWEYPKEPSQWDRSFEHPKHTLKLMGKKMFIILRSKYCLSKPMSICLWKRLSLFCLGQNFFIS